MLRVTFLGRKWLWRSSQCAVCTVRDCGFVGCGRHDLRTSLESALLLSLSSQLRPLRHYIPRPLYSLATSLFFVITSYESTNALQSINLSVFTSLYSLTTSPFFVITSYKSTNALQSPQPLCLCIHLQYRNLSLLRHYILPINECWDNQVEAASRNLRADLETAERGRWWGQRVFRSVSDCDVIRI